MSYSEPCGKSSSGHPFNRERYAVNVPCDAVNPTSTGVRRKMIFERDPTTLYEPHQANQGSGYEPYVEEDSQEDLVEDLNQNPVSSYYWNPHFSPKGNLERLKHLINEENERVTSSEELARSVRRSVKRPKTFNEATRGIRNDAKINLDVDSDIETYIPAAILRAEERGISLGQTQPSRFYGRLFPEDKERPTVEVLAASRRNRDKVMPKMTGIWRQKELEYDLDAGMIDFLGMKTPKKPAESPKPAAHEPGGDINDLLGVTSEAEDDKKKNFNYVVNRNGKHRSNFVQLRGSSNPSWFPGYMYVIPGQHTVQYAEEPYGILDKAWRSLSPSDVDSPHGNYIVGT